MIFTSYYANQKNIPATLRRVSVSMVTPIWAIVDKKIPQLAPTNSCLTKYKDNQKSDTPHSGMNEDYFRQYTEETHWVNLSDIEDNDVLMCYEKRDTFCHRHIIAHELSKSNRLVMELRDKYSIAVVGSRSFQGFELLESILDPIRESLSNVGDDGIGSGGAMGADILGEKYGHRHKLDVLLFIPEWGKYGNSAGFIRNKDIVINSDIVVAFWDYKSNGTRDTIRVSLEKHKPLVIVNTETGEVRHYIVPPGLKKELVYPNGI